MAIAHIRTEKPPFKRTLMHDEQIMYAGKRTQIKSVEFVVYFILCTAKKKKDSLVHAGPVPLYLLKNN